MEKSIKNNDKYKLYQLKAKRGKMFREMFNKKLDNSVLSMIGFVIGALIALGVFVAMIPGIIMLLEGNPTIIIGCLKALGIGAGIAAVGCIPTAISAFNEIQSKIKSAELEVASNEYDYDYDKGLFNNLVSSIKQKLAIFKSLTKQQEIYKHNSVQIVESRETKQQLEEEIKNLKNTRDKMASENESARQAAQAELANIKAEISGYTEIKGLKETKDKISSEIKGAKVELANIKEKITDYAEIKDLKATISKLNNEIGEALVKKDEITNEIGVYADLKTAKNELGNFESAIVAKNEYECKLDYIEKQMTNRRSLERLLICEYKEDHNVSIAPFYYNNEWNFTKNFGHAQNGLGYWYVSKMIAVADVLNHMGWGEILALGTISDTELIEVINYVIANKEVYGFTFEKGEYQVADSSFNNFLKQELARKRTKNDNN